MSSNRKVIDDSEDEASDVEVLNPPLWEGVGNAFGTSPPDVVQLRNEPTQLLSDEEQDGADQATLADDRGINGDSDADEVVIIGDSPSTALASLNVPNSSAKADKSSQLSKRTKRKALDDWDDEFSPAASNKRQKRGKRLRDEAENRRSSTSPPPSSTRRERKSREETYTEDDEDDDVTPALSTKQRRKRQEKSQTPQINANALSRPTVKVPKAKKSSHPSAKIASGQGEFEQQELELINEDPDSEAHDTRCGSYSAAPKQEQLDGPEQLEPVHEEEAVVTQVSKPRKRGRPPKLARKGGSEPVSNEAEKVHPSVKTEGVEFTTGPATSSPLKLRASTTGSPPKPQKGKKAGPKKKGKKAATAGHNGSDGLANSHPSEGPTETTSPTKPTSPIKPSSPPSTPKKSSQAALAECSPNKKVLISPGLLPSAGKPNQLDDTPGQHGLIKAEPSSSSKTVPRVGLSRRARIPSLLRTMRK
ncbi:MAG: hypothetical protein M1814_001550 [Vezdaea aestivalis]|nr:MAG: hypothetical protein M1814_001550 [Vezdaea aestivalis]